jgi:hypothetical protein
LNEYIGQLLADIVANPEKLQPVIDSLMKSVMNRPGGILPKEATIKLPFLGKVPAAWFEPLVKSQLGKIARMGTEKAVEAASGLH